MQKWRENNKIFQAQKISLQIVSRAVVKSLSQQVFKRIVEFSKQKKKQQTVENLLKIHQRQSSLQKDKQTLENLKVSLQKRKNEENDDKLFEGTQSIHRQSSRQKYDHDPFGSEYSDKENNINLDNISNQLTANHFSKNQIIQQKIKSTYNKIPITQTEQYLLEDTISQRIHNNMKQQQNSEQFQSSDSYRSLSNFEGKHSSRNHYQQKSQQETNKNKNANDINVGSKQKSSNLSNFQSIQSTTLCHYVSTEMSDNEGNNTNYQKQYRQNELSTSPLDEIYHLINDKSSMVYNNSKKQQNSYHQISSNTDRSSSSYSAQNILSKQGLIEHPLFNQKDQQAQCFEHKQAAYSKNDNNSLEMTVETEKGLKFNKYIHSKETQEDNTLRQINQQTHSYQFEQTKQKLLQSLQGNQQEYNQKQQQQPIFSKKELSNTKNSFASLSTQHLNQLSPSKKLIQSDKNKIQQKNEFNYSQINSSLTLSPIPRNTQNIQSAYNQPLEQNYSQQQKGYLLNSINVNNNASHDALSFTQSQIKNSLNVQIEGNFHKIKQSECQETQNQQHESMNIQNTAFQNSYDQNNHSQREVGKIKRNSVNQVNNKSSSNSSLNINSYGQITNLNSLTQRNERNGSSERYNQNNELISYVKRSDSSHQRLNEQLELQAQTFNLRKSQSKDHSINLKQPNPLNISHSQLKTQNSQKQNLIQKQEDVQEYIKQNESNNNTICICQKGIQNQHEKQDFTTTAFSQSQLSKPPLQIKFSRMIDQSIPSTMSSVINNRQNYDANIIKLEKQPPQKVSDANSNLSNTDNEKRTDSSFCKQSYFNYPYNIQSKNQNSNISNKNNKIDSSFDMKIQSKLNKENLNRSNSFHKYNNEDQLNSSKVILTNKENSNKQNLNKSRDSYSEKQNQINNSFNFSSHQQNSVTIQNQCNQPSQIKQQQNKLQRSSSISSNSQPYMNYITHKQLSQNIIDAAQSISQQQSQFISVTKQQQINQLRQYQNYKSQQTQKQQQQQQSQSHSNNTSYSQQQSHQQSQRRSSTSRNTSFDSKKKQELTNVGQNIQNILYFEAKIRSKRIARSQERAKNDSLELCKKLESLESYIQQINSDLVEEKQKRNYLLEENQMLLNNERNNSLINNNSIQI